LARELLAGSRPYHWRGAIIHAYYAVLLECRDTMAQWGFPAPPRHQVHATIRLRLVYASDRDVKNIGLTLERLGVHRNRASYDLRALPLFATDQDARDDVQQAVDILVLLDGIDADPARRAVAIASIRP